MESTVETLNDIRRAARQAFAAGNLPYSIELYEHILNQTKNAPLIDDVIHYGAILRKTKQLSKANRHYCYACRGINLIQKPQLLDQTQRLEHCRLVLENFKREQ